MAKPRRRERTTRAGFNDDEIRRGDLPTDVFRLLHDLAYHHAGRPVVRYVFRTYAPQARDRDTLAWVESELRKERNAIRAHAKDVREHDWNYSEKLSYAAERINEMIRKMRIRRNHVR